MNSNNEHSRIKFLNILLAIALALAFVPIVPKAEVQAEEQSQQATEVAQQQFQLEEDTFDESHVVVKFKDSPESDSAEAVLQEADSVKDADGANVDDIGNNWATVDVEEGKTAAEAIEELKRDPRVEDVIVDNYMELQGDVDAELATSVNDPQVSSQWHISDAYSKVQEAWDVEKCNGEVTVAIVDSGMDADHPDLVNNTIAGKSMVSNSYDDKVGHGTAVAGIISAQANNGIGVAGVSYNAKILPIKVTDATTFNPSTAAKAINWAVANRNAYNIKVINMSFGSDDVNAALRDAINSAYDAGIICVCATGNRGSATKTMFPASMDNTIAVGAVDKSHNRASYSNGGSALDVVAPGSSIYTTLDDGDYGNAGNGTSFACPFVAATAALCYAANSEATPSTVKEWIVSTAKDLGTSGKDNLYGYGQVVVKDAVQKAKANESYQVVYRLYNPYSGEHFYTMSWNEYEHLHSVGWRQEGVGWNAPVTSSTKVYRLYNPYAGDHHYTTSADERDFLIRVGWNYEGVGWYSADSKTVPIYRQYNPNAVSGAHNFTASKSENDWLASLGWHAEGIAWYGL